MNHQEPETETQLSAWMRAALEGDRAAYGLLLGRIRELAAPFLRTCLNRAGVGDDAAAEDLVQEVLLAIHAKRATYDPAHPFLPWMYAIARYKLIDHLRSLRVRRRVDLVDDLAVLERLAAANAAAPEGALTDDFNARALLASLPEKQRHLIELVKLNELSIQEASIRTGFSPSDVKVSIHRGIQALRKRLRKHSPDKEEVP